MCTADSIGVTGLIALGGGAMAGARGRGRGPGAGGRVPREGTKSIMY